MKELSDAQLKAIHGGNIILAFESLNFIGEFVLLGSFFGFLISPVTTPNAIIVSGIVGGVCATSLLY